MRLFCVGYRFWLPVPEDGLIPLAPDKKVRLFDEQDKKLGSCLQPKIASAGLAPLEKPLGWYPIHADGSDDHETANLFVEKP